MSRIGRRAVLCAAAATVVVGGFGQPPAHAIVLYSWIGTGSGNWSTPANWGGGLTPVPATDTWLRYVIPAGSASVVSNNDMAADFNINVLWLTNNATSSHTIQGGALRFNDSPTQQQAINIQVPSGTLTYGGVTISNDLVLTNDLILFGTRFTTLLSGQISGPGRLSANVSGTFNVTGNNSFTGGSRVAFGSQLWVTGSGNLGTGSTQIGDEQEPVNWFGLGKFDSAANVASGNASVYVGGNSFVQFQQLDQNAIARINPSSRGMLVIDNSTVVAPTLDLSNYPNLRLGAFIPGVTNGSVTLSSTIIPSNNTYRFGAQDSGGTTPYDEDTLNVTSPLTDGPGAQPRAVNIGPGVNGLGGKIKLANLNNTYTGGTVIEHGPLFFDLTAGLVFDYAPTAGQTPLGTGSVQVGGSMVFEGSFGGVGALPNPIVFKPGSKLLFNNVLLNTGTINIPATADRWGDTKPLDLNGTELTLRAVSTHTEIVGPTTYADDNHLLVERTGAGSFTTPSGTVTFQMQSLSRVGRATMTISGIDANTFGQTHRVAITNPANLVDPGTGMIHPSIVGDRPGDTLANPGEFLMVGAGNVLVPSNYNLTVSSASDSEIAAVANGAAFSYGSEETLWALRAGSQGTTFSSGLHIRSGGLILAGSLGGSTVSFDDHGTPVEGLIYVPAQYNTTTIGTATINSTIVTANGITKFGGGSLTLNAANTFTGGVNINDGWLRLGTAGAAAINNNPVFIGEDGTLDLFGKNITLGALSGDGAITSVFSGTTTLTLDTSGGDMRFNGRIFGTSSRIIAVNKTGPNTLTFGGYNRYHGLTTVSAGTLELAGHNLGVSIGGQPPVLNYGDYTTAAGASLRVSADNRIGALTGAGDTYVASAAQLTATSIRQNLLNISAGGRAVILRNGGDTGTSRLSGLVFGGSGTFLGQLELGDNDLVLDYASSTNIGAVANMIKSGYASGAWTGNGLASSAARDAANNPASRAAALGYAEASQIFTTFPATFSGQSVDNTTVLVRYTLAGDNDLSGSVDLTDFTFLAANFNGSGKTWLQGDYNYDGNVDLTDFTFLASNFNQSLAADGGSPLGAAVPEPAAMGSLLMLSVAAGFARRRARTAARR